MCSSYQRGCHGKVDDKKNVIWKERRSKENYFWAISEFILQVLRSFNLCKRVKKVKGRSFIDEEGIVM
jgi:hypothetical protein